MVQVIEQQLNGIDDLDYITAEANADGTASISLTFKQGTNPDIAQVQVQNKLQARHAAAARRGPAAGPARIEAHAQLPRRAGLLLQPTAA